MSSEPPVVELRNVTKTFRVGLSRARMREMIPPPFDARLAKILPNWWWNNTFDAVHDVSFNVERGVPLGLVGHNGAGKTTLLKVMSGVTEPTKGEVTLRGRAAAILNVMVAFNSELTGRENIYIMGALYGFSRARMKEKEAQIFDFAEIDELADTPVKRYSAGMGARLGFAVITALDFDCLMIDEVLAVGDVAFQRKCIRWFEDYRDGGGTLLFVSHNMGLVRSMTDRCVWLDHGEMVDEGPTGKVLNKYARAMEKRDSDPSETREMGSRKGKKELKKTVRERGHNRWGAGCIQVDEVHMDDVPVTGKKFEVTVNYESRTLDEAIFCIAFIDEMGRELGGAASAPISVATGHGSVVCVIDPLPLRAGVYFPVAVVLSPDGVIRDRWRLERALVVEENTADVIEGFGPLDIPSKWATG